MAFGCLNFITATKSNGMKNNKPKTDKTSLAIVGFACGVLTVILLVLAMKGC